MFISSKIELIQVIKNLTINNKEVRQIDFIYPNFSILHTILKNINFQQKKILSKNQILAMEILEILKQTCDNHNNIEVNIHTLNELDFGQNVNLKDLSSSEIYTKAYLKGLEEEIQDKKQGKGFNLFYYTDKNNLCIEFINTLKKLVKDSKDIKTLDELIQNIDTDNISSEKFDEFKNKVLEKIESIVESDFFKNNISPTLKNTYEKFIDELLEHIKKLAEEKEYEKIKIILSAIAGIAIATVAAVFTGGTGLAILTAGLFSLMGSANEYYELTQKEYGTLLTPMAAFLATRCAMFIHYINSRLLSCVLIIDKKEIIDLSGFGLYLGSNESNIASNLAYRITLSKEIKSIENIFNEIFLSLKQKEQECNNKANVIPTQKLSNLYLKNNTILENLQKDIRQFNHLSYIESPNFNSSKLVEFFAQKNQNAQTNLNTTTMNKNYLIISNIPSKYNAGLTESLTQEIANIQDKYRKIKKSIDTSKKTYGSTRDYSEYSIEIPQDENAPYILQLSPFVKISKESYEDSKKAYEDMQNVYKVLVASHYGEELQFNYNPATMRYMDLQADFDKKLENIKLYNYMCIKNFFKQNEEKESIIEKERKLAHQYLSYLQDMVFKKISNSKQKTLRGLKPYSIKECLQISWELYRAKQTFGNLESKFIKNMLGDICVRYLEEKYFVFEDDNCWIFEENNEHIFEPKVSVREFTQDLLDIFIESNKDNDENKEKNNESEKTNENIEKFFNELLKELNLELTDEELKQRLQEIYGESFLEHNLKESKMELYYSIFWEAISSLIPLGNFIYHIKDPIKVAQNITNISVKYATKGFKEVLIEQLSIIYLLINPKVEAKEHGKKYFKTINKEIAAKKISTIKEELFFNKTKIAFMAEQVKNDINVVGFSTVKKNIEKRYKLDAKDVKLLKELYYQTDSMFYIQKTVIKSMKWNLFEVLLDSAVQTGLDIFLPTNFKALQEQYESIVYQLYTFKYDSPLAVIRENFVTYPFVINSKFISFDLKKIFYGIDLCTGVFDTHFSFHYEIKQNIEENKEFLLRRLLSYLIIDEKRNATALVDVKEEKYIIDDYTFYSKELNSLELKKCTIYQLPCSHSLFKNFRNKEKQIDAFKKDEDSPIHAYNEVLQILQDFANGIYNVKYEKGKFKEDKNKARRLLEKLNIIGQNNLKAMYMKIEEKEIQNQNKIRQNDFNQIIIDKNKDQKSPPNFIGRLATTIIIEDGLYLG
ncbi:hypothetical protein [Campylobacter helveticus]|uniref:hypothetical protein n=1 Tax=Campylobacter helveticus TaxID=28898 RepID=UPI0022EAB0CC|nr:hypothetical protein [Campylobacter helveticus]